MMRSTIQRTGPYLAAAAFTLGLVLSALAVAYRFHEQRGINSKLCDQTVENRMAIRDTWNAARVLILRQMPDPSEQRDRTNEFFDAVLLPIPPLVCKDNRPVPEGSSNG